MSDTDRKAAAAQTPARKLDRVVVEIYGISYPLRTDEPEKMKKLAQEVDQRMKQIARSIHSFDERRIAVLAALSLAEEKSELQQDYDDLMSLLDEK